MHPCVLHTKMLFLLSCFLLLNQGPTGSSAAPQDVSSPAPTEELLSSRPCSPLNASCPTVNLDSIKSYIENRTVGIVTRGSAANGATVNASNLALVDKLSNQVRIILKHFQSPEPIGLPGQDILTEPMHAPDTNASMVLATGYFSNISVWGLSNFSISSIETKLDEMEIGVVLYLKSVLIDGNYSVNNLFMSDSGPFNITLTNVTANGTVDLEIDDEGKLYANQSTVDMSYDTIDVILSGLSTVLIPFVSATGAAVLQAEKAHILANVNERIVAEINTRLADIPKIPSLSEISPVDLAVLEGRKFVKAHYEPFVIPRVIDFENPFVKANIGPVSIHGLSKFARVGNVTLLLKDKTVIVRLRMITGRLFGSCHWAYDFGDDVGFRRKAQSNFTVEHIQIEAKVNQSIDSRKPPILDTLQVEMGQVGVKMDRNGNFDYWVELLVPMLPKILRLLIIDVMEDSIKEMVQRDVLNHISVEQVIEENMPSIKKYLSDKF